ncbi:hypothetical protein ABIE13_003510 [Ottowia thiooxydans]|uniref:Uncharacterized protein n=2 Tax=Ottowia thiooxydans TaxID=219182 RepID=A0ABV2QBJ8_9BURK
MKIFQIFYDDVTRQQLDPAFIALDNSGSERPDWFEYWPIRKTLLHSTFDDEEYLGFFSPRFQEKTRMAGSEVIERVSNSKSEVISFSPFLHESALYPNSFYQGDAVHAGFLKVSQEYFDQVGIRIDLRQLVQDQTRTIFSNYFVAKYRFWKKWRVLADQLFQNCEARDGPLSEKLNAGTLHRGKQSYQMKIFIMERVVSLALELEKLNAEIAVDQAKASIYGTGQVFNHFLVMDALKGQYLKTGSAYYLGIYLNMRKQVIKR